MEEPLNEVFTLTFSKDLALNCISFFAVGIGKLGIRNNCDKCMKAVVSWTPLGVIDKYSVPGFNQIVVDVKSMTGQLIGEEPC